MRLNVRQQTTDIHEGVPTVGADLQRHMMYKCKELTAVMKGRLTHVMMNTENYLLCNMHL